MSERRLFILVEGNDDERFFARVIIPLITHRYRSVKLIKYACLKSNRVCRFVRSIHRSGDEILVVTDIDQAPGVAAKKRILMERFCVVHSSEIMVIIQEIESWYLAGLEESDASILGVHLPPSTDNVTKEMFNSTIPPQYVSRIAYMLEILSRFSIPAACQKNRSFHHFMDRYYINCDVQSTEGGTGNPAHEAGGRGEGKVEKPHHPPPQDSAGQKGGDGEPGS